MGIDSKQIFIWGGKPTNLEEGGKVYVYNYKIKPRPQSTPDSPEKTFQVKRPEKRSGGEDVEKDPHFSFHAMVELDNKYYDPSYGFDLNAQTSYPFSNVFLEETVNLDIPTNPKFKLGPTATQPFTVKAIDLYNWCVTGNCGTNTVPTQKYCSHSLKPAKGQVRADFDNDGKDDSSVFRPSDGTWYVKRSSDQSYFGFQWGANGDKIVPADYDGDGKTDFAVFRPSNGFWYIVKSSDNTVIYTHFGISEDKPVLGDYDGDGKSDITVFRPSSSIWYRLNSSNGAFFAVQFGLNGDVPVSGDYDGDAKTDIAVFRPSNGTWYSLASSNGSFSGFQFGISEDIPVPADFDNDDKTDIAVFRPSNNTWYIQGSTDGFWGFQFGASGDIPSVGSFDEDGIPDPIVWSPNTGIWKVLRSETNTIFEDYWGKNGDIPIHSAYNR